MATGNSDRKMWIGGLKALQKPLVHLHTQFNRDIPWNNIDMDFMNLNQSAHGDREFRSENVDRRIEGPPKTPRTPPYTIQQGHPLEQYRHGFHEPQPKRPWRPGI